jgi:hypothetical protein
LPPKFCQVCGRELPRRVFASGNRENWQKFSRRRHCSFLCRTGHPPRQRVPCRRCGGPTRTTSNVYCSRTCRNASYVRVPTTEKQGRNQAQKRYQLQPCEHCGATRDLHRHHRDHNPLNNDPSNIGFFCSRCHTQLHVDARAPLPLFSSQTPV